MTRIPVVVPADGALLDRILDDECATENCGLSRPACGRFDAALMKTAWGRTHRRRFALTDGDALLASAQQYLLAGTLDRRPVRICGIDSGLAHSAHGSGDTGTLVERLLDNAARDGTDIAVLLCDMDAAWCERNGFERLTLTDVELGIAQSARYGDATMTLVRGGEERDLQAIAAMGKIRAAPFRFHLERDVDFVRFAITRKRLLAGLGSTGTRQLHFFIAEEGITAAAYVVVSVEGRVWTIEECGDRDPSGARVGAILQGLIAREPNERRPVIRGRLPPGFVPPQVTILSTQPSTDVVMVRALGTAATELRLAGDDVLLWHDDVS